MNQATPINKLKKDQADEHSEELIDNVLKEMDKSEDSKCEQPQPVKHKQMIQEQMENASDNSSSTESSAMINTALKNNDVLSSVEADEQAERIIDDLVDKHNASKSLFQRILDELKSPILVIVLYVLFQSGIFSNLLNSLLGKYMDTETGYFFIAIKAFLFGLLYYVFKKLLF